MEVQSEINIVLLQALLVQVENPQAIIESVKYKLKKSVLNDLSLQNFYNLANTANKINQKYSKHVQSKYHSPPDLQCPTWSFGEFKVFTWISVCFCHLNSINIYDMKHQHFHRLKHYFPNKPLLYISYQFFTLILCYNLLRQWNSLELILFKNIIDTYQHYDRTLNWKTVAYQLYSQSQGKYFRNLYQCREKWTNYFNPMVNKAKWTMQQDLRLFQLVRVYGCKWSLISKRMDGIRTEHMVKNRYNSYFKKSMKNLVLKRENQTIQIIIKNIVNKINKSNCKSIDSRSRISQQSAESETKENHIQQEQITPNAILKPTMPTKPTKPTMPTKPTKCQPANQYTPNQTSIQNEEHYQLTVIAPLTPLNFQLTPKHVCCSQVLLQTKCLQQYLSKLSSRYSDSWLQHYEQQQNLKWLD